ncbi:hypothetical protein [Chitinophaga eiseniae]|uniref:Uncharacterized protein n=1 Tax=Chitinophaga eiseniae TaxID=634771 RepID=A0A847SWB9_9BACT|nr:hypothetical protein [Chitinophaga eiseniae]NLR83038.1 hypothetical protein [Chitinophaga eiseniae]
MNKQYNLLELIPDKDELEKFIADYANREALAASFIPSDIFIQQEIEDITHNLNNRELFGVFVEVGNSQMAQPFMHSICATKSFEALTRGRTTTIGQIIDSAKVECDLSNKNNQQKGYPVWVSTGGEFEQICFNWIKIGVTFAYYIKYLYNKKSNKAITLDKFRDLVIINTGDGNFINIGDQNSIDCNTSIQNK